MLFRKELAVYHKYDITKLNDVIKENKYPHHNEDTFVCHRRRLHRFTKTSSSPYEGIFIKKQCRMAAIRSKKYGYNGVFQ